MATGKQQDNFGNYQPNLGPHGPTVTPTSNGGGVIRGDGPPTNVTGIAGDLYFDNLNLVFYQTPDGVSWQQLSGGGGGGTTQVFAANYGGSAPNFTPISISAVAADTSTGRIWWYYNNQWN